jgi:hypothetical protein
MNEPDIEPEKQSPKEQGRVPKELLLKLIAGLVFAYGLDLVVAGAVVTLWSAPESEQRAQAFLAGHCIALIVGLTWIVGGVFSMNRSPTVVMASTMVLSPVRYVGGVLALVGFAGYFKEQALITILGLSFVFTQIFNHVLQSIVGYISSECRAPERDSASS